MNIHDLMESAVAKRASDVHLAPRRCPAFRIDGALLPQVDDYPVVTAGDCEEAILRLLSPAQIESLEQGYEVDIGIELEISHATRRFRINVHRQQRDWLPSSGFSRRKFLLQTS